MNEASPKGLPQSEVVCPFCRGNGRCGKCMGTGRRRAAGRFFMRKTVTNCLACEGSGVCPLCHGAGKRAWPRAVNSRE